LPIGFTHQLLENREKQIKNMLAKQIIARISTAFLGSASNNGGRGRVKRYFLLSKTYGMSALWSSQHP
jgi:Uri superfamily endonuclease